MLHCTTSEHRVKRLPPVGSIQALVQVARLGSLKAAADSLALSPPALTRRIQALEQFIGSPLLVRQNNTVHLNSRGEEFLAQVEHHIDGLANAIDRIRHAQGKMRIRIAVPSLFASQRLVPALPDLRQQHPTLMIDVDTGANRIARLGDSIDAAIAITESVEEKHYARMIERGRIVAIGSDRLAQSDPPIRAIEDLERSQILLHRGMPGAFNVWRRAVGLPNLEPAATTYFDAGQLILDAAGQGLGVAFMLESHLRAAQNAGLQQLFSEKAESPYAYWFVCSPSALERTPVRLFHNWLFNYFGNKDSSSS